MNNRITVVGIAASIVGLLLTGLSLTTLADDETTIDPYNNILKRSSIASDGEVDVLIREILFSPGWLAPKHFHNADLFTYVIEGEFEVTMEDHDPVVYSAGQALEMRAKSTMDARNPSATNSLKLAVFQVGAPDSPFVVPVE